MVVTGAVAVAELGLKTGKVSTVVGLSFSHWSGMTKPATNSERAYIQSELKSVVAA